MQPFFESKNIIDEELKFMFEYKDIDNTTWPIHWEDSLEILHGVYGETRVMVGKDFYNMKPGDTVIINAQTLHNSSSEIPSRHHCLKLKREWFLENGIDNTTIRFETFFRDPIVTQLLNEMDKQQAQEPDITYTLSLKRALADLMIYLLKNYSHTVDSKTHSKGFAIVLDVMEYITKHYSEPLNIGELASIFGYSKYHFSRLFKQYTDQTIVDYINAIRCEVSTNLLRTSSMSVTEIAQSCGFNTPPYFAKQFKKFYGISPLEYRTQRTQ